MQTTSPAILLCEAIHGLHGHFLSSTKDCWVTLFLTTSIPVFSHGDFKIQVDDQTNKLVSQFLTSKTPFLLHLSFTPIVIPLYLVIVGNILVPKFPF